MASVRQPSLYLAKHSGFAQVFPGTAGALVAAYAHSPAADGSAVGSSQPHSIAAARLAAGIANRTQVSGPTDIPFACLLPFRIVS